jgi:hypothetical protein
MTVTRRGVLQFPGGLVRPSRPALVVAPIPPVPFDFTTLRGNESLTPAQLADLCAQQQTAFRLYQDSQARLQARFR